MEKCNGQCLRRCCAQLVGKGRVCRRNRSKRSDRPFAVLQNLGLCSRYERVEDIGGDRWQPRNRRGNGEACRRTWVAQNLCRLEEEVMQRVRGDDLQARDVAVRNASTGAVAR